MSISAGTIYVDVRPDTKGLTSGSTTSKMGKAMSGLAKVAAGAFVAKQVFDFGGQAIAAAEESEAVLGKLGTTLTSMGREISVSTLDAQANSIQALTGISDESIKTGQTLLATFSSISDEMLTEVTPAMVDFSAQFTDGNMRSAATMLGKALGDPIKGLSAMSRVGVSFTEEQKKMITRMTEAGNVAGAQGVIMEAVGPQIAGAAEAQATASGKMKAAWGDFMEILGRVLLPIFEKVIGGLQWLVVGVTNFISSLQKGGEGLGGFGEKFGGLMDIVGKVVDFFKGDVLGVWDALVGLWDSALKPALSDLMDAFKSLQPVLAFAAKVYFAIYAIVIKVALKALPILIKALGIVIKTVAFVIKVLSAIVGVIFGAVSKAFTWLVGLVTGAWDFIKSIWEAAPAFFSAVWSAIVKVVSTYLKVIVAGVKLFWNGLKAYFKLWSAVFKVVWKVLATAFKVVAKVVTGAFKAFWAVIKGYIKVMQAILKAVWEPLKTAAKVVFGVVKGIVKGAWSAIKAVWQGAKDFFFHVWDGLLDGAKLIFNAVIKLWNNTIGKMFHGQTIGGQGPLPSLTLPDLTIPELAQGGIVTQPMHAIIGEAGPEAVIPLNGSRLLAVKVVNPQDFPDGQASSALTSRIERSRR